MPGIWITDGAMGLPPYADECVFRGERFAGSGVELRGNLDVLNLTAPRHVAALHKEYVEAGAELLRTNTRGSDRLSQAPYGLAGVAAEMALEGARIARGVADAENARLERERRTVLETEGLELPVRQIRVAGTLGTTPVSLDLAPRYPGSPGYGEVAAAYHEQLLALAKGGVDCYWLGRCGDPVNLRAFLDAWRKIRRKRLPLVVTLDPRDRYGNLLSAHSLQEYATLLEGIPLMGFGFEGPGKIDGMRTLLKQAGRLFPCRRVCCLDATVAAGRSTFDEHAEQNAHHLYTIAQGGLIHIAGGGLGTTPAHICATATALTDLRPQALSEAPAEPRGKAVLLTPRGERQGREAWLAAISLRSAGFDVDGPAPLMSCPAAAAREADLLCLCGATEEVRWQAEILCRALAETGRQIPLILSGKGSDALHTTLRLAPVYASVFHAETADDLTLKATRLRREPEKFREAEARDRHLTEVRDQLRHAGYGERPSKGKSVFRSRLYIDSAQGLPPSGTFQIGAKPIIDAIDWKETLRAAGCRQGKNRRRLPRGGPGNALLDKLRKEIESIAPQLGALVQVRFCAAYSEDDCIQVRLPDGTSHSLPMLRQEKATQLEGFVEKFSLADFVPHITQTFLGPVGFFSIRMTGIGGALSEALRKALRSGVRGSLAALLRGRGKIPKDVCVSLVEAGTPLCPDRSLRRDIADILTPGISPEDGRHYGMVFIQRHSARVPIAEISPEQLSRYAARRGMSEDAVLQALVLQKEAEDPVK